MLASALRLPALAALLLCVSLAPAAVIDGTIGVGEYPTNPPVIDADNETTEDFYNSGLDIDVVYTDQDATDFFLGISVEAPPFDFDGSPASFLNMTAVYLSLYADDSAVDSLHDIGFLLDDNGAGQVAVLSTTIDGTPIMGYSVAAGAAFEASIPINLLTNGVGTYLRLQVDDMGAWDDDQVAGIFIPEPATLALLAVGAFLPLLRKRR